MSNGGNAFLGVSPLPPVPLLAMSQGSALRPSKNSSGPRASSLGKSFSSGWRTAGQGLVTDGTELLPKLVELGALELGAVLLPEAALGCADALPSATAFNSKAARVPGMAKGGTEAGLLVLDMGALTSKRQTSELLSDVQLRELAWLRELC